LLKTALKLDEKMNSAFVGHFKHYFIVEKKIEHFIGDKLN
jgi:hypothetical protein